MTSDCFFLCVFLASSQSDLFKFQIVGGLCALLAVYILALPVPIIVHRWVLGLGSVAREVKHLKQVLDEG